LQEKPLSTSRGNTGRTRVFKKESPNGKLTVYLGKRNFVDHINIVDPVDDPSKLSLLHHTSTRAGGHREGLWCGL
uniref:Uncharacterized protein n=1 Tax=Monodelphis domestica TaxID=13616 RepID=A0A5F8HBZ0_MONDO